ncbi:MAG: SDR family NAD(P)-dependent oxidoreductase [Sedimentisphaeraceae bacterium JB056]
MKYDIKNLFDLRGKVAVVTGGAGWLGRSMSEALAELGAVVIIIDKSRDAVDSALAEFEKSKAEVYGVIADTISDETEIRKIIDDVYDRHKRLDILVNCAVKTSADLIDKVGYKHFAENSKNSASYVVLSQQAAKYMRKNESGGSIINIASMYGTVTGYPDVYEGLTPPNPITYQADKAAVIQITKHMAVYYAKDGIRVNSISPGPFPNSSKKFYAENPKTKEFLKRLEQRVPMKRYGKPYEIKGAVALLASQASSFMTGQNIHVDGGWTIW